jgi:hypothetical protein
MKTCISLGFFDRRQYIVHQTPTVELAEYACCDTPTFVNMVKQEFSKAKMRANKNFFLQLSKP